MGLQEFVHTVYAESKIKNYISEIVDATRLKSNLAWFTIPAEFMNADQIIYDIVYRPMKTGLLREA